MKRMERFLEKKIFLKKQHREIINREIEDLKRELKKNQSISKGKREQFKLEDWADYELRKKWISADE